jgi:hypothetical protein
MPRHAAAPREFLSADVALVWLTIGNNIKIIGLNSPMPRIRQCRVMLLLQGHFCRRCTIYKDKQRECADVASAAPAVPPPKNEPRAVRSC